MSSPLANPDTSLIPLSEVDLAGLEILFDEECAEWLELLKWDFKGASMLIRDVARQRKLAGFAVVSGTSVIGFAYYLIEGSRCSIGDIYVSRGCRGRAIDRDLVAAMFEQIDRLTRSMGVATQRVELPGGGYTMDHSAVIFLLDDRGRMVAVFTAPFDAARLADDVRQVASRLNG